MVDKEKELYRYIDSFTQEPKLLTFYIVKETPKGYYISKVKSSSNIYDFMMGQKDKWIHKESKRSYAYFDKEQALYSYFRRKVAHEKFLNQKLSTIKKRLLLIRRYIASVTDHGTYKLEDRNFIKSEDMRL